MMLRLTHYPHVFVEGEIQKPGSIVKMMLSAQE
jgi:hypothetical protein